VLAPSSFRYCQSGRNFCQRQEEQSTQIRPWRSRWDRQWPDLGQEHCRRGGPAQGERSRPRYRERQSIHADGLRQRGGIEQGQPDLHGRVGRIWPFKEPISSCESRSFQRPVTSSARSIRKPSKASGRSRSAALLEPSTKSAQNISRCMLRNFNFGITIAATRKFLRPR
jgi:hypothetical protein